MKRIVAFLLIISMLFTLSSCKEETDSSADLTPEIVTAVPLGTELPVYTKPKDDETIHIYSVDYPFRHKFSEDCEAWEDYMLKKHGVLFELDYVTRKYDYNYKFAEWLDCELGIEVDELKYLQDFNGFVVVNDLYTLSKLKESGIIMPVNEFIDDIEGYTGLPDEILASYMDPEGNIWGLPTGDEISIPRRIYNKEWLEAYGKGEPVNLDEFYDYAQFIAFEDPDGNGLEKITELKSMPSRPEIIVITGFADIKDAVLDFGVNELRIRR